MVMYPTQQPHVITCGIGKNCLFEEYLTELPWVATVLLNILISIARQNRNHTKEANAMNYIPSYYIQM